MIKEEIINYKKELEVLEKRRRFLLDKINSLEVELQNIYVFNIDKIMPIIEELINKKYQSNYKLDIIEYPGNKVTKKYYYVLKEYNIDTTNIDEITLWDKIYDYNLILIGITTAKKDVLPPNKISFNKKENNKNIVKFQSADAEIEQLIRDFIEYVIQNKLRDNNNLIDVLNQYLKPRNRRKKQLTM